MSKKYQTNLAVCKKEINFARVWLISVNKVPRLRTRLVFKTAARNKEHKFIGLLQNTNFNSIDKMWLNSLSFVQQTALAANWGNVSYHNLGGQDTCFMNGLTNLLIFKDNAWENAHPTNLVWWYDKKHFFLNFRIILIEILDERSWDMSTFQLSWCTD